MASFAQQLKDGFFSIIEYVKGGGNSKSQNYGS